MGKYQRILLCTFIWLILLCLPGSAFGADKVVLQLKWFHQFQFAGYYAAKEKGFYAAEGLDVVFRQRDIKTSYIDDVLEGKAQYGTSDAGLLFSRLQGKPVVVLSQIFQHSPLVLLTLKESGLRSPHQLAGKKVMIDTIGFSDAPANGMLFKALGGFEQFQPIQMTFRYEDLSEKKVDAVVGYVTDQPFKYQEAGVEVNILDPRDYGVDFYGDNLFTTEKEIREHPQRVEKMIRATLKGWDYALQHSDKIVDLILKKYNSQKLSREHLLYEAEQTAKMIVPNFIELGSFEASRFTKIAETYVALGLTDKTSVDQDFLYGSNKFAQSLPEAALTAEEQAWIKQHPVIRVSSEPDYAPFDFVENGKPTGFSVDYLNMVARRAGLHLEYVQDTWKNLVEMGKQKQIDLIHTIFYTPGRAPFFHYTEPYKTVANGIFVRDGVTGVKSLQDLAGKRVIIARGDSLAEALPKVVPDAEFVFLDTYDEILKTVSLGQGDATVMDASVANYLIREFTLTNIRPVVEAQVDIVDHDMSYRFAVRKDWRDLRSILQKAMNTVTRDEMAALEVRWFGSAASGRETRIALSVEELKWLAGHRNIRLGVDPAWPPFEFIDKSGHYAGIGSSFIRAISDRLNIKMTPLPGLTWSQVIEKAKAGEIDVLPAVTRTSERDRYLNFTKPFLSFPVVTAINKKIPFIGSIKGLEGYRVGVVKDYYTEDILRNDHPYLTLVTYPTMEDALQQLDAGSIDAFVGNMITITQEIARSGLENTKVSASTEYTFDLSLGVRKDLPELVGILNKAIDDISSRERAAITSTWMSDVEVKIRFDFKAILPWAIPIGGSIFLIVAFVVVWNRKLGREILERKRTEDQLRKLSSAIIQARQAADEANQAKSDFLANMSHEIRTPMNAVIGMSHLALKTVLTPKQKDYLNKIQSSANSLLGIINDILDFSKIEAGKLDMESVEFNLDDVLDNLANLVMVKAQEKENLEVLFATAREVPRFLLGDPLRLGQVLINLVNNAVKFTDSGEIVVSTELRKKDEASLSLKFSVRDTGIGLTEEQIGRLFQSFSQADTSTTRKFGGTGLGLTISKRLVNMMGGEIWVESKPGQGTTFNFTAKFGLAKEKAKKRLVPSSDMRGMKVLVVDDSATSRNILRDILESFSFEVTLAASGEEGLEDIQKADADQPFELVLMDWKMPGLDGIEASKRIKNHLALSKLPAIILVTAYGREEIVQQAEQIGLDGFLIKPVSPSVLFDTTMQALGEGITKTSRVSERKEESKDLKDIQGAQILLVEDNEINQQVAKEILAGGGLNVTVANDGQEAVNAVKDSYFDAILMDIQMPVMDGYAAAREIRKWERRLTAQGSGLKANGGEQMTENSEQKSEVGIQVSDIQHTTYNIPIIAMTAHAMAGDEKKSIECGMNDHVTKPIDPDKLFTTLQKWIKPVSQRAAAQMPPVLDTPPDQVVLGEDELPESLPGFDLAAGLERLRGNKRLYRKLLLDFGENYDGVATEISEALEAQDFKQTHSLVHNLKGLAGNLEAINLQAAAVELEKLVRGQTAKTAPDKELKRKFVELENAIQHALDAVGTLGPPADKKTIASSKEAIASVPRELIQKITESIKPAVDLGDVMKIKSIAEELKSESDTMAPFCNELVQLAEDFDFDGIQKFILELNI